MVLLVFLLSLSLLCQVLLNQQQKPVLPSKLPRGRRNFLADASIGGSSDHERQQIVIFSDRPHSADAHKTGCLAVSSTIASIDLLSQAN